MKYKYTITFYRRDSEPRALPPQLSATALNEIQMAIATLIRLEDDWQAVVLPGGGECRIERINPFTGEPSGL